MLSMVRFLARRTLSDATQSSRQPDSTGSVSRADFDGLAERVGLSENRIADLTRAVGGLFKLSETHHMRLFVKAVNDNKIERFTVNFGMIHFRLPESAQWPSVESRDLICRDFYSSYFQYVLRGLNPSAPVRAVLLGTPGVGMTRLQLIASL